MKNGLAMRRVMLLHCNYGPFKEKDNLSKRAMMMSMGRNEGEVRCSAKPVPATPNLVLVGRSQCSIAELNKVLGYVALVSKWSPILNNELVVC
jgi:hypothetical protein